MATGGTPDPGDNPFTDADLAKILHEEQTSSREEGWTFIKKNDLYEAWRKQDSSKPVHLVKGFLHFKDIPPEAVADIVHDVKSRTKWDKLFPVIEVLETYKEHRIVYWLSKMPFGVADRDLVQKISTRYDEATNTTYNLYYHTTHPSKPEVSGVVRAETILTGVIIRPHPDYPNSTRMSLLFQLDMKGWIPHFIVNAFAERAPGNWQENLTTYYWNDYSKQGKSKEEDGGNKEEGGQKEDGEPST